MTTTSTSDAAGAGDAPSQVEDEFLADLEAADSLEDLKALWDRTEKNSPAFTYLYSTGMLFTEGADRSNIDDQKAKPEFSDVMVNHNGAITDLSRNGIPVSQSVQVYGGSPIDLYPSTGSSVKDGFVTLSPIAYRYFDGDIQVVGSVENRTTEDAWVTGETYQEDGGEALTQGMVMLPVPAGETHWFAFVVPFADGTGGTLTAEVTIGGQISTDDRIVLEVPAFG